MPGASVVGPLVRLRVRAGDRDWAVHICLGVADAVIHDLCSLDSTRGGGRKTYAKNCASAFTATYLDNSIVLANKFLSDPKPKARTNQLFCRKEGFKDASEVF
jgi:hypothetical protein